MWLVNLKNNITWILGGVAAVVIAGLYIMLGITRKSKEETEKALHEAETTVEVAEIVMEEQKRNSIMEKTNLKIDSDISNETKDKKKDVLEGYDDAKDSEPTIIVL